MFLYFCCRVVFKCFSSSLFRTQIWSNGGWNESNRVSCTAGGVFVEREQEFFKGKKIYCGIRRKSNEICWCTPSIPTWLFDRRSGWSFISLRTKEKRLEPKTTDHLKISKKKKKSRRFRKSKHSRRIAAKRLTAVWVGHRHSTTATQPHFN